MGAAIGRPLDFEVCFRSLGMSHCLVIRSRSLVNHEASACCVTTRLTSGAYSVSRSRRLEICKHYTSGSDADSRAVARGHLSAGNPFSSAAAGLPGQPIHGGGGYPGSGYPPPPGFMAPSADIAYGASATSGFPGPPTQGGTGYVGSIYPPAAGPGYPPTGKPRFGLHVTGMRSRHAADVDGALGQSDGNFRC